MKPGKTHYRCRKQRAELKLQIHKLERHNKRLVDALKRIIALKAHTDGEEWYYLGTKDGQIQTVNSQYLFEED